MANTAILRYKVEPVIRAGLEEEFAQSFGSRVLALPGGAVREFDAVSNDGTVVVSIKTSSGLTSGGNIPGGKINGCIADLYYLSLLKAPVRRLVLTNPQFHAIFTKRMAGAMPEGVEVRLVPLPPDLQAEVDGVIARPARRSTAAKPSKKLPPQSKRRRRPRVRNGSGICPDVRGQLSSDASHTELQGSPKPQVSPVRKTSTNGHRRYSAGAHALIGDRRRRPHRVSGAGLHPSATQPSRLPGAWRVRTTGVSWTGRGGRVGRRP
jgi:hypothetical protein